MAAAITAGAVHAAAVPAPRRSALLGREARCVCRISNVSPLAARRSCHRAGRAVVLAVHVHSRADRGNFEYRSGRGGDGEDAATFSESMDMFNVGDYYACHDAVEELWNNTHTEPQRGTLHGILQCAVGFHHLLNDNHRGALLEMGEGMNKLRKAGADYGGLYDFVQQMDDVLEFVYNTQMEWAACDETECVTMDGGEESYDRLGDFGAGQKLYTLELDAATAARSIAFTGTGGGGGPSHVDIPIIGISEEEFREL